MARLASQVKGGFYAAHPAAIEAVLSRIETSGAGPWNVLDPCAGEGAAIAQIGHTLNAQRWAVELDENRSELVRTRTPAGHSLAPADFFHTHISPRSMSMVWCNPPYDYETGEEGRTEWAFVERAEYLLIEGGLMALVCPENIGQDWRTTRWFRSHFENRSAMCFPEEYRHYNEVVLLGTKRKEPDQSWGSGDWDDLLAADYRYRLPSTPEPRVFLKTEPTDKELLALIQASPLRLNEGGAYNLDSVRPPLPPGKGHLALLLSSGHLNGMVTPEGETPHVLRGTSLKEDYLASVDTTEDQKGASTTRTVYSQRIKLLLRVLTADGELIDLL